MKKIYLHLLVAVLSVFVFSNCQNKQAELKDVAENLPAIDETEVLHQFLELSGNFINSPSVPSMVTADEVFENINNKAYYFIDMRSPELYESGHIENAVNVGQAHILDYFKNQFDASKYEKIVLVCKSGQLASYANSILQLLGYKNVYAMKRGMSGWNKQFADEVWLKHAGSSFADKLETTANPKAAKGKLPKIETGKRAGIDILEALAENAIKLESKDWGVTAEKVFENPANYYVINYWTEKEYNAGHIPGAVQYTPKKSLSRNADLATLPADRPILVYCYTGQHAAYVVAYLRLLGYNAHSVLYGANGFMNSKMNEGGAIGHAFTSAEVKNYPVVLGPNPTDKVATATETPKDQTKTETPTKTVKKKQAGSGGGGC
jgi:rhodanese-related sulfurtransferase